MNRRSFLAGIGALVGGIAIEQAIPFNRVWSFPRQIVIPQIVVCKASIEQYADFINVADLYLDPLISAAITDAAEQLAYRTGLGLSRMVEMCQ